MNRELFESKLNEVLFNEYFNCYLALPIFPRTIQYFLDTDQFEEVHLSRDEQTAEPQESLQVDSLIPPSVTHSHAPSIREDNYVATLERERALEWVLLERLPSFLNSDLFCEYKLASLLARVEESREKQPNVPLSKSISNIAISSELNGDSGVSYASLGSKKAMSALKKFLAGTGGENDYLFWVECERLSSGDITALKEIKEKYTRPGAKCELAKGRWVQRSQPVTRENIFALQTSVLHSLVSYWCPRYLISINRYKEIKCHPEHTKRSRPGTHQGRGSVLNDSQMDALKCNPESVRELASPLIFPQLSPTHFPLSSTPNPTSHMPTARSISVIAPVNRLPDINEYLALSESVTLPHSHTIVFPAEAHKRRRSRSVPLPKIVPPVKERNQNQQLTRCLSIEHRKAGGIFQQYIEKVGNTNWKHCLFCWREIQNFKAEFQTEDFNPFQVEVRAKTVFSRYVLTSGDMCVHCPYEVVEKIGRSIYPAFEDLFDSLEELVLDVLAEPWMACLSEEHTFLDQAKSDEVIPSSHWEIDDEEFLEELGADVEEIEIEHTETAEDIGEEFEDEELDTIKVAVSSSLQLSTPISYTIQQVIQENTLLNLFKSFLDSRHASVDIMFWMEVESFRRIPSKETKLRNAKAKLIRSQYLTKNYYFGVNSPASKEGQNRLLMLGGGKFGHKIPQRPPTPVLIEGQKQVQARLEHRWLPVFIKTREFLHYINPGAEQGRAPIQGTGSGSQEEWKSKLFESRWMTNSRDIINCRKAILNPVTCRPFETFIELKSSRDEHLKNDLNFWLEIQRFKELCHVHTPDAVLQLKVDVITSCFLQSKVPPKIQVDLSHETVEKLHKKPIGPYLYREPQAEMFRVIFSYWMEYQAFKEQHKGEDIEISFMELRQQIHEREMVKFKKQREFEQTRIRQQLHSFGMGHGLLHGDEDPPADLMFRLSEVEGDNNGVTIKKRANRTLSVQ